MELGMKVKDMVSGFQGIITGKVYWLNGCERVLISPDTVKQDGGIMEGEWFDVQQVSVIEPDTHVRRACYKKTGGPMIAPEKHNNEPKS